VHILVIDGYEATDPNVAVVEAAIETLRRGGHDVVRLHVNRETFGEFMSAEERRAYETDQPLCVEATRSSARALRSCDALLFCYPTTFFGVPPALKSWMERVLVSGVAFTFDHRNRIRPGLTNVRRLGVITTTPHDAATRTDAGDLGYRVIMQTLRLNCHRFCRRTFVRLRASDWLPESVEKAFQKW